MARKKKHDPSARNAEAEAQPQDASAAEQPSADQAAERPGEPSDPGQEIERLKEENLRLLAELRNVTQRAQREKSEALKYAETALAKELLPVLDDLERTLASAADTEDAEQIIEGVRIVHEHFLKVLRHRHIQPIDTVGKPFDPDRHEALMQQPSDEHPPNTVIQEVQRGYTMHDRVIRPAKVIVSAAPAEAATD